MHVVGGAYVFNAVLQGTETYWQYDHFPGEERLVLRVDGGYFERRGVVVVSMVDAKLNSKAETYAATPVAWIDSMLGF